MSHQSDGRRRVPAAARVFGDLQADDALNPGGVSALRRTSALFLTLLFIAATPLFFAAFAAGVIGDPPAALAKGSSVLSDDDDSSGPGSGDDDDDTGTHTGAGAQAATDDTSANGASTKGTTNDNDTKTKLGTDDTSKAGADTKGTTMDNDTQTNTGTHTQGTGTGTIGQTITNTNS